jgi:hypothetical protein
MRSKGHPKGKLRGYTLMLARRQKKGRLMKSLARSGLFSNSGRRDKILDKTQGLVIK